MLAITIPAYCEPSGYELTETSPPVAIAPTDVVVQVHATSVNPVDVKKASGIFKAALKEEFPYRIGYDCAGIVTEVGQDVTRIKVGDEVYARFPEASRGTWAEYAKCPERFVAIKPKNLSFAEAASIPLAAMTAFQALKKYKGSLAGKTVFIPAGLSGTGSFACQLAKNVFKASRVITTVSTAKVGKVPELLGEGVVDQIIDYTKDDPAKLIPPKSIDFFFDTTGQALSFLSLMFPSTSTIISVSTQPSGTQLQDSGVMQRADNPRLPWYARTALNVMDSGRKMYANRWGVAYEYLFLDPNAENLETLRGYVEQGEVRPVAGARVDMRDIEAVRKACDGVFKGKGGVGKTVLEVVR